MAKNYVQPGTQLTLVAPTGGVTTGVGVLIGTIFAIALRRCWPSRRVRRRGRPARGTSRS
jgi:predicted RecA/RadA family phage recombinase